MIVCDPNLMPCFFSFSLFFFFFYHVFIVFRYKKLRAALAMERTKPINPKKQQKKALSLSSAVTETPLWLKSFAHHSLRQ